MVKTKQTPRRSDMKTGKLPPLSEPKRDPKLWGTPAKTFVEKFRLPMHPDVQGSLDYRSKSKVSKITYY